MPNMNAKLNVTQQQKLTISPQLQHAIKLLQMNSIELSDKIENELAENPFLEEISEKTKTKENKTDDNVKPLELEHEKKASRDNNQDEEKIESYFADSSDIGYYDNYYDNRKSKNQSKNYNNDTKQAFLEGAISTETTFYEDLISQLRLMNITDKEFMIGEAIISSLDEEGYFREPLSEIAESMNVKTEEVNQTLSLIQSLDPPGVGARDLQECLIIQIDRHKETHPIAKQMVVKYLETLLQQHKYKEITSRLNSQGFNVTLDEVVKEAKFISNLEPYPARNYEKSQVKYIIPDVTVRKSENGFDVFINEEYIPKIGINRYYKKLISKDKKKVNENTKKYLNNKYSEAKLLISSIEKRRSTIRKVVEKIVEYQSDFFEKGPQYLKPLTLRDIADKIDMHESTISRVTTDKYMETPWGIVDFKYFFSSGIEGKTGSRSATSIKELIKEIIENESNKTDKKALTDTKIVEILSNRGIKIARRTVAKYRKALNIMPSYYRKRIGAETED